MRPNLLTPRSLLLSCLALSGCTVGPRYEEPKPEVPGSFASKAPSVSARPETEWWRKFNDPQLNSLIAQAEAQNRDLKVAAARVKEARALWTQVRYDLLPTVTSGGGYTNIQTSRAQSFTDDTQRSELYDVGFDATWELDLYGRVRSTVKAAKASEEAVQAEQDALLIALRADVALNYLLLRGAQAQLDVAQRNGENQAESLRIAEASLQGGRGTQLDVARARAQWNATLATIPQYQISMDHSAHRIAVLCGAAPATMRSSLTKTKPLPAAPSRVSLAKPAEVLRQRPDIRVAERNLAAATARIGVATADLFPRVTFNGNFGLEAATLSDFGRRGAGAYNFGPRLSWPAFDLGRVRQQIVAAGARGEGALALYEQTVLEALEDAESALTTYAREQARLKFLRESSTAAEEAANLARQRYKDGIADFLDVLDSERVALAAQNDVVASQVKVAVAWVAVNKAMAW